MNSVTALSIAKGQRVGVSIDEFYDAYQYLYDNDIELEAPEYHMLDKLICDGVIVTEEQLISHRGLGACSACQLGEEV